MRRNAPAWLRTKPKAGRPAAGSSVPSQSRTKKARGCGNRRSRRDVARLKAGSRGEWGRVWDMPASPLEHGLSARIDVAELRCRTPDVGQSVYSLRAPKCRDWHVSSGVLEQRCAPEHAHVGSSRLQHLKDTGTNIAYQLTSAYDNSAPSPWHSRPPALPTATPTASVPPSSRAVARAAHAIRSSAPATRRSGIVVTPGFAPTATAR
jgi:hypothetical protein